MTDWSQTNTDVSIFIPISYKVDLKKVDYAITEWYIKLNIHEMKLIKFIDLDNKVIIALSRMVIEERRIIFILKKEEEGLWKELEFKGTKEEKKARRQEADRKLEEKIKNDRETAAKKKQEYSKIAIDQSIKIDDDKRNELLDKKNQEKVDAEQDLYKFVNKMDNKGEMNNDEDDQAVPIEINPQKQINRLTDDIDHIYSENKPELITQKSQQPLIKPIEQSDQKASFRKQIEHTKKNDIFTSQELNIASKNEEPMIKVSENQKQEIRQQTNIPVNLTEKKIPTFAARESLSKEPPYPKSKQYVPEKNYLGQEIDDRNPIWTKERADNFFNNHDYRSAVNAYNKALELDPSFHKCLLNRGTCLIRLGEYDLALKDFEKMISLISAIEAKEKEDAFYDKLLVRAYCKMYGVYAFKLDYSKAIELINSSLLIKSNALPFIIPDNIWKSIEKDKELILMRQINEEKKIKADALLAEKKTSEAKEMYLDILSNEKDNERVLSNLSLIYLNENNYDEVIKCCTVILARIKLFKDKIKMKNIDNSLEIKTLLRRANCYEKNGEMSFAEKDIEQIERLEIKNEIVFKEIKDIKDKLKMKVVETYKDNANSHLAKKEFSEALGFYDKAISLIKYSQIYNKIDLVKILINRTSCFIKLSQYEKSIEEFEKIEMILSKQKAIATIQSNLLLLDEIKKLSFSTLVKRAFVFATIKENERAIRDYEAALELKPEDISIKENLAKLKLLK